VGKTPDTPPINEGNSDDNASMSNVVSSGAGVVVTNIAEEESKVVPVVVGWLTSSPGKGAATGTKSSSPFTGGGMVASIPESTRLFLINTAIHLPARSSNFKISLMSATTIPANLMAPINLTYTAPPSSTSVLQLVLPSTR
jgi:hypothetical protein